MATISLNDSAPTDGVHFSFGAYDFDLKGTSTYDTDDPSLIADAGAHPWLTVRIEAPKEDARPEVDENDPHQNPQADHLSSEASPEAIEAAEKAEAAIREAANADVQTYAVEEPAPKPKEQLQLTEVTG